VDGSVSQVILGRAKPITHRDQIHGDVRYDPLSVALLNTPALQRLGRVFQLGYAHLVFRGGTHTRLSHVMGASHVAGKLVDLLRQNYLETKEFPHGAIPPEDFLPKGTATDDDPQHELRWEVLRHLVRWAALLHDLGHIPLGHTLEDEFEGIYTKHDHFDSPRMPYLWDADPKTGREADVRAVFRNKNLYPDCFRALNIDPDSVWKTVMVICLHTEEVSGRKRIPFGEVLVQDQKRNVNNGECNPFIDILSSAIRDVQGETFFPYMADIVGNTICADYLDYLRRDPTNVGIDVLRDDRVASRFFVGRDANELPRMALALTDSHGKPRRDTCTGVVELVRQRFRFAEIIYYHKTKVAASAMLAKVFTLLGKPPETGRGSRAIEISEVDRLTKDALNPRVTISELKAEYYPSALLDPEIGDETLLLWLQDDAWGKIEQGREQKNAVAVNSALRGLSLLQGIVRRKLFKVSLTLDRTAYKKLCVGSTIRDQVDRKIQDTLDDLREKKDAGQRREKLEQQMAEAAGWPLDSILLYVPPRKSQAKGIETGALDDGDVITLGTHPAVRNQVEELNKAYLALWRMIVLVHPEFVDDAPGLSEAVDVLVKALWTDIDLSRKVGVMEEAAWFPYISAKERVAARTYAALVPRAERNWRAFKRVPDTVVGTISSDEHADRATLLTLVPSVYDGLELLRTHFDQPGSLSKRMAEERAAVELVEGHASMNEWRRATLEKILADILPGAVQRPRKAARGKRRTLTEGETLPL
jgi:HD superfamily phosphohydrolase